MSICYLAYLRLGIALCVCIRLEHGPADAGEAPGGDGLGEVRPRLEPHQERVQGRTTTVRPESGLWDDVRERL